MQPGAALAKEAAAATPLRAPARVVTVRAGLTLLAIVFALMIMFVVATLTLGEQAPLVDPRVF